MGSQYRSLGTCIGASSIKVAELTCANGRLRVGRTKVVATFFAFRLLPGFFVWGQIPMLALCSDEALKPLPQEELQGPASISHHAF